MNNYDPVEQDLKRHEIEQAAAITDREEQIAMTYAEVPNKLKSGLIMEAVMELKSDEMPFDHLAFIAYLNIDITGKTAANYENFGRRMAEWIDAYRMSVAEFEVDNG